jgi:PAS domain S-box-containing protein
MKPASVLIVEDEAVVALDLRTQLQDMGYVIAGVAESGDEALEIARRAHPDVALMDVRIRGPMDGIEVARRLAREQQTPVIYLTAYSDAETVRSAAETAPYGYLTKPFQAAELKAGIEVALTKSRMERRLRESERWFASTLRCVQDGVMVTEPDGRLRFMNLSAEALTGWRAADAVGQPVSQLLRFEDDDGPPDAALQAMRDNHVVGVFHARRLRARDGHVTPVDESAAPVDDEFGHRLGAVVVLRDATERLRQEERLRASEQRFRSAFDHAPLGMALVSMDGHVIQANDALCRLLGGDGDRLAGRALRELSHPEDAEHERLRLHELLGGDQHVVQFETRYLRAREVVWTLVSVSLWWEAGQPVCYLYQVQDLTAQRKAAERLAELAAERMKLEAAEMASRAKSEFLARMSHELRTPLNAVLGFAQIMKLKGVAGTPETAAYIDHILQAGQHLVELVDDVLDLQGVAAGRMTLDIQPVPLATQVDRALELLAPLAAQYRVSLDSAVAPGLTVRADAVRLREVLLNVGSNAVKYNQPGGTVQWRAEPLSGGRVQLRVTDTGPGIPPDALVRLFQPFERLGKERTAIPGTGLGLAIARGLMEEMGGSLSLTSQVDVGTTALLEFAAA